MASAIILPIVSSELAEIVPTCATSLESRTDLDMVLRCFTAKPTATSMPRLRSIGSAPAAILRIPSRTMAWAKTVAVVVPSPASSDVLVATWRTIWAPMFSTLSSSSISFATVTPSLVIRGAPNDFSITTLRPLGPNVTLTAFSSLEIPRNNRVRLSAEKIMSFAAMGWFPLG